MPFPRFHFVLALIVILIGTSNHALATIFDDPIGDTIGVGPLQLDLLSVESETSVDDVRFSLHFTDAIAAPSTFAANSLVGFIDIDLDQDISTGTISHQSQFSPGGSSGLGTELFLDLFSEQFTPGIVDVIDTVTNLPIGTVNAEFNARTAFFTVPLNLLGGDRFMNYGVMIGTFAENTDEATNPGEPPAFTVPEPGTLFTTAILLIGGLVTFRLSMNPAHEHANFVS